jgi:hypothetical protein
MMPILLPHYVDQKWRCQNAAPSCSTPHHSVSPRTAALYPKPATPGKDPAKVVGFYGVLHARLPAVVYSYHYPDPLVLHLRAWL